YTAFPEAESISEKEVMEVLSRLPHTAVFKPAGRYPSWLMRINAVSSCRADSKNTGNSNSSANGFIRPIYLKRQTGRMMPLRGMLQQSGAGKVRCIRTVH